MSLATVIDAVKPTQRVKAVSMPLADALLKLDIVPFDRAKVEAYKEAELDRAFKETAHRWEERGWTARHHRPDATMYMADVRNALGDRWTDQDRYLMFQHVRSNFAPSCLCMGWHKYSVDVDTPNVNIPDFVARKMAQISAEVPGVSFTADVLETQAKPYDPFLIVSSGQEEYYIEIWGDDDHKFSR